MAQRGADVDLYAQFVEETRTKTPKCGVSRALLTLGDDREPVERALADSSITGSAISRVLRRRGVDLSDASIQRHRRRVCQCND